MHNFLKTIGFSNLRTRQETEQLLNFAAKTSEKCLQTKLENGVTFAEIYMDVAEGIGIALRGDVDTNGIFRMEHYFPYFIGKTISMEESVFFSKKVDSEAYTGMSEDRRVGVSMIFFLQNAVDFLVNGKQDSEETRVVSLAALASSGKVLLPTVSMQTASVKEAVNSSGRAELMEAAKKGDKEAIETLTIDDIDLYEKITRRLKNEDIFSIVETSFVPYGSESDNYTVLGIIDSVEAVTNKITGEKLYVMDIRCNDIPFPVCINASDLLGEPKPGRRFRGNVWMQGHVDFSAERKA